MKHIKHILFSMLFLLVSFASSAQTIENGGGITHISAGADPNAIVSLQVQDASQGEAVIAFDVSLGRVWKYDDQNAALSKWEIFQESGATTVSYVASTGTITIDGVDQVIPLATATVRGLLGGITTSAGGADLSIASGELDVAVDIDELTASTTVNANTDYVIVFDGTNHVKVLVKDLEITYPKYLGNAEALAGALVAGDKYEILAGNDDGIKAGTIIAVQ